MARLTKFATGINRISLKLRKTSMVWFYLIYQLEMPQKNYIFEFRLSNYLKENWDFYFSF